MTKLIKQRVPPNVKFEIDNAEQPWTWQEDFFDLVHMRTMTGCIHDWDNLFSQAFQYDICFSFVSRNFVNSNEI